MENKSHALAAGAFVLLLAAMLVTLAVWLTRDSRQLRVYEISSKEEVTGLQPEASVRFKGVTVGKVTRIGFDPQAGSRVLIRIAIDDSAPITTSTFASLGFQGVTGLAFVQLDDSGESGVALAPGGGPAGRIPMRPGLMSKLSDHGEKILRELEESSRRINQLLSAENQKRLVTAIGSMGQAADSLVRLSGDASKALPPLTRDAKAALQTLKDTSLQVGDSADEARASARAFRTVTERMNEQGGTLDQLTASADTLVRTGRTINYATLPRINQVADEVTHSARQVGRTLGSVGDNPQSLIFGNAPIPPGPGEPGFSTGLGTP
jgi:phospholipid/cholesterol/gamma-HCH transport system substrate-binding protein